MITFASTWLQRHGAKVAVVAVLSVPALVGLNNYGTASIENRALASWPERPRSLPALLETPAKVNAWINDHFGYRAELVRLNNELRFTLLQQFPSIQMTAGRHGRYFLGAHGTNVPPYQALTNVCGTLSQAHPSTIPHLNRMFAGFKEMGFDPKLIVIPSAPLVYSEDVPAWLEDDCASSDTPVTRVMNSPELAPEARTNMFFPLAEMREIKKTATLYPDTWFHWTGLGLDRVARLSLTHFWQRDLSQALPMKFRRHDSPSDVSHLFDGVTLSSEIEEPDLEASQVKGCFGEHCFPELGEAANIVSDINRFDNQQAPQRRLLMITDSFGAKIAPWYANYYGRVEQFATNNVQKLTPEQLEQIKTYFFRDPANTDLLVLYHDGGAMYNTLRLGTERLLPADAATAAAAP